MMLVTGSNKYTPSSIILSIRLTPSGLYYSITKNGGVHDLNYLPFGEGEVKDELIMALSKLEDKYDYVNVLVDTCDLILLPKEVIEMDDVECAKSVLNLNSVEIGALCEPIITEDKHGIRALFVVESYIVEVLNSKFTNVKFCATILSDIHIESNAIVITINDNSMSISCCMEGSVVYADVMTSSVEVDTLIYYIQSLRSQFVQKKNELPVYLSGVRSGEVLAEVQTVISGVSEVVVSLDGDALDGRVDISSYNDLIRLSNENN